MALFVFLAASAPARIVAAQGHSAAHRLRNEILVFVVVFVVVERIIVLVLIPLVGFRVVVSVPSRAAEIVNGRRGNIVGRLGTDSIQLGASPHGFPQFSARPLGQQRCVAVAQRPRQFQSVGSFRKPERERNPHEHFVAIGLCKRRQAVQ